MFYGPVFVRIEIERAPPSLFVVLFESSRWPFRGKRRGGGGVSGCWFCVKALLFGAGRGD